LVASGSREVVVVVPAKKKKNGRNPDLQAGTQAGTQQGLII
jgi:hypothetical protein